jgi:hypothetical protein
MMEEQRSALNMTTGDLDVITRLEDARREIGQIADELLSRSTSRRETREAYGRRLNAVKASLRTVELRVNGDL